MSASQLRLLFAVAAMLLPANLALCQTATETSHAVSVCELLANPRAYADQQVKVTGKLTGWLLWATDCSLDLYDGKTQWPLAVMIDSKAPLTPPSEEDTVWGPASDVMVELAGRFIPMRDDKGFEFDGRRRGRAYAAKLEGVSVITARRERPSSLSVCEVAANPVRYDGRVVTIDAEYRWDENEQVLYAPSCGPEQQSKGILLVYEKEEMERAVRENATKGPRRRMGLIANGRIEAWKPDDGGQTGRGYGKCGCYAVRMMFPSLGYIRLLPGSYGTGK